MLAIAVMLLGERRIRSKTAGVLPEVVLAVVLAVYGEMGDCGIAVRMIGGERHDGNVKGFEEDVRVDR